MVGGATGLIPSQFLEEKRKAFVPKDWDGAGKHPYAYIYTLGDRHTEISCCYGMKLYSSVTK